MKSMNQNHNTTASNTSSNTPPNNWLGFSLSPYMKMEAHTNHQTESASASSVPTAITTSFFQYQPQQFNYGIYFGGGTVEGDQNPLPVMPLKSDGSLCIMEALTRSQPQATTIATSSTPKLEDFFGGASLGTHQYDTEEREVIALSLDSMYYHNQDQPNNQNSLNQHYSYYSNFRNHEMLLLGEQAKETQLSDFNLHLPTVGNEGIKMIGCMGDNGGESGPHVGAMAYGDLESLSLSMSPSSQSSCVTGSQQISPGVADCSALEINKKRGAEKLEQKQIVHRKSIDTFGQRTSQYRGVTRHRWTGRYEAHLWDNTCKKEGQSRKGRQVYLGGYDMEEKAARAYDLAALKYWGPSTHINFPLENYQKEIEEMNSMTRQEYVAHLRRKSSGFSRGASMYRGVTRHHQHGRWQARIGRVAGNKDLYLGTFSTQEEAAEAYDIAAIKFRGTNAVTNFDTTRYDVERIMASNTLLTGELARRKKEIVPCNEAIYHNPSGHNEVEAIPSLKSNQTDHPDWKMVLYHSSQQLDHKPQNVMDGYRTQAFSLAPENLAGFDNNMSLVHQQDVDESAKIRARLSNASSLVSSVSNSREGSPDRGSLPMLFAMPSSTTSKLFPTPGSDNITVTSWMIPSPQLKPTVALPHMPVFASWADS